MKKGLQLIKTGEAENLNSCSLHSRWSPTYDVSAILTSIQSLLSDPNPNSPANSMAAQLFKENRREYEKRVKACVEQSWSDD